MPPPTAVMPIAPPGIAGIVPPPIVVVVTGPKAIGPDIPAVPVVAPVVVVVAIVVPVPGMPIVVIRSNLGGREIIDLVSEIHIRRDAGHMVLNNCRVHVIGSDHSGIYRPTPRPRSWISNDGMPIIGRENMLLIGDASRYMGNAHLP